MIATTLRQMAAPTAKAKSEIHMRSSLFVVLRLPIAGEATVNSGTRVAVPDYFFRNGLK
jgi:hypothetical protein